MTHLYLHYWQFTDSPATAACQWRGVNAPKNLEVMSTELVPKAEGKNKQTNKQIKKHEFEQMIGLLVAITEGTAATGLGSSQSKTGTWIFAIPQDQQKKVRALGSQSCGWTPYWCLQSCFVQVQPGQDPKEDPYSPWGLGGGSCGEDGLDLTTERVAPVTSARTDPNPNPEEKLDGTKQFRQC